MSRPPKTYDNKEVSVFLSEFYKESDLCEAYPPLDDIFAGLLNARTPGDTATRSLSRSTLFQILSLCPVIDSAAVFELTKGKLAKRTVTAYASLARTASLFIRQFMGRLPSSDEVLSYGNLYRNS